MSKGFICKLISYFKTISFSLGLTCAFFLNTTSAFSDISSRKLIKIGYDFRDKPSMLAAHITATAFLLKGIKTKLVYVKGLKKSLPEGDKQADILVFSAARRDTIPKENKLLSIGFSETVGWWASDQSRLICKDAPSRLSNECLAALRRSDMPPLFWADIDRDVDIGKPCISKYKLPLEAAYTTRAAIYTKAREALGDNKVILIEARSFSKFVLENGGHWLATSKNEDLFCSYSRKYLFMIKGSLSGKISTLVESVKINQREMVEMLRQLESHSYSDIATSYWKKKNLAQ